MHFLFMKNYKYVFFDLDDTLWDFRSNANTVLMLLFSKYEMDKYYETFDHFFEVYINRNNQLWDLYGKGEITRDDLNLQRFLHPFNHVGINDQNKALSMSKDFLGLLPFQTSLMPHTIETLEYLHELYPLSIISNGFFEVQHQKLQSTNLGKYFTHIVLSESAGALKPHSKIFEYAMNINQAKPCECIMIGDSYEADIKGAMAVGIDQVYFNGSIKLGNGETCPNYTITNLLELKSLL
jgi:YjjG family noncanonical pyrimidine nucleotidase